jgi:hypothetical protein
MTIVNGNDYILYRTAPSFLTAVLQWLLRAIGHDEDYEQLEYLHITDEYVFASDGYRAHYVIRPIFDKLFLDDPLLPAGAYRVIMSHCEGFVLRKTEGIKTPSLPALIEKFNESKPAPAAFNADYINDAIDGMSEVSISIKGQSMALIVIETYNCQLNALIMPLAICYDFGDLDEDADE